MFQSISFVHTSRELTQKMTVGGYVQKERKITYFALQGHDGYIGCGELSPLLGLHQETHRDAFEQLASAAYKLRECPRQNDKQSTKQWFMRWKQILFPSVRFCLDMAIEHYWNERNERNETKREPTEQSIPVQALLWGEPKELLQKAVRQAKEGYKTFKIKVGRKNIESDINLLQELRKTLPQESIFRLDANRCWQLEEAIHFSQRTKDLQIDYIEEPLADSNELISYAKHPDALPFAYDESLIGKTPEGVFSQDPKPKAVILKSQSIGDIDEHFQWQRKAQKQSIKIILSSCFETDIGLSWQAVIANHLNPLLEMPAMGFDTLSWFSTPSTLIQKGTISITKAHEILHKHAQETDWKWRHLR